MPSAPVRFWNYVDKSGGPDACWPWTKATDKLGYGFANVNRKVVRAHRYAWVLARGDIPNGLLVLHSCDNPPCCNPAHLWLGTDADNNADMRAKGRGKSVKGVDHPGAKLKEADIKKIFALRAEGWSQQKIANHFGVYQTLISMILLRQAWKHVTI